VQANEDIQQADEDIQHMEIPQVENAQNVKIKIPHNNEIPHKDEDIQNVKNPHNNKNIDTIANTTEASNDDDNQPRKGRLMEAMEARYGSRNSKHALQPRCPCNYSHLHATLKSTVMTQHSMKKGIKLLGYAGISAVLTELKQLHNTAALGPKNGDQIAPIKKKRALQYLMFLKKKQNGTIKG
jgi:hypothetical protein